MKISIWVAETDINGNPHNHQEQVWDIHDEIVTSLRKLFGENTEWSVNTSEGDDG